MASGRTNFGTGNCGRVSGSNDGRFGRRYCEKECASNIRNRFRPDLTIPVGNNTLTQCQPDAYLSRYTHRIAISNSRLIAFNDQGVTFKWKDYRAKGQEQAKVMTLATDEFIRRCLMHVPPSGFHRIRHYGLLANGNRAENIARARQLLKEPKPTPPTATEQANDNEPKPTPNPCPCCGGRMLIIERYDRGCVPRHQLIAPIRIDSS